MSGDLFAADDEYSFAAPWWERYLTGGECGPGGEGVSEGKYFLKCRSLREQMLSSVEAAEMGWASREIVEAYWKKEAARKEQSLKDRNERYRNFKWQRAV
jgi:hypothetical protein